MGFIAWIVLGGLAGWIASLIMKTDQEQGLVTNVVVGVLGALVGGFLFEQFGSSPVTGFNFYSLFVAVVGSVITLFVYKALTK